MNINEPALLIKIESYIINICNRRVEPINFFNQLSRLLIDFNEVYNPDYSYFGCVEAFIELRYEFNEYLDCEVELEQQLKNISFEYIKQRLKSYVTRHKRKLRDHRYSESENAKQLIGRMRAVSNRYARILVVRLDLAYKQEHRYVIGIEHFDSDMRILRQHIHNQDGIFEGLIEYAWALEQGTDKGYHCHLMLIYNGHKHQKAFGIAKRVSEVWEKITLKQGSYFNCHSTAYLRQFEDKGMLGVGVIHRVDREQVENMLATVQYLVHPEKEDQHLRVKVCKRMRTFG